MHEAAAAAMAATFAAPVASVLLAVELLLFEWKPRSVVPVALACATAAAARRDIIGAWVRSFPCRPIPPSSVPKGLPAASWPDFSPVGCRR
ncbi:MAG: chloride channel protein [Acidobacteriota bacterium]